MRKKKEPPSDTIIHVKATSKVLSVSRLVPENYCISELEDIRDNFKYLKNKYHEGDDHLSVSTCVHNPKLQLR